MQVRHPIVWKETIMTNEEKPTEIEQPTAGSENDGTWDCGGVCTNTDANGTCWADTCLSSAKWNGKACH